MLVINWLKVPKKYLKNNIPKQLEYQTQAKYKHIATFYHTKSKSQMCLHSGYVL